MQEDNFLTYSDAVKLFVEAGLSDGTFRRKVKDHPIRNKLPEGRTRGALYSEADTRAALEESRKDKPALEEVDINIASTKTDKRTKQKVNTWIFRRARPGDTQQMYELGERIMSRNGGYGIRPEQLAPYLSIPNSEIGHVLVNNDEIIGYFTIVPLTHEQLMQRMRKEVYIADFPPESLPRFEPGRPIDCFVWEIMSEPVQKQVGQYLISKMLKFFHNLGKRGVDIEGVYATATSIEGINLSRRMGMDLMDLPEVTRPNYMPFELKIQEKRNWITRDYIQGLRSYRLKQDRLQTTEND